jgi:hypothetical protein
MSACHSHYWIYFVLLDILVIHTNGYTSPPTHCQDIVEIAAKQGIDGQALQSLYRTGGNSGDALHSLIREEFGAARLGHRLRLLEGLSELFSSSTEHNRQQAESSKHEGIKAFVAE